MSLRKKPSDKKLGLRRACPCESGLRYGECCHKKGIEYRVTAAGKVVRSVKIHPRLAEELKEGERRFREIFGRRMGHDLILFDQFLTSEEDQWQEVRNIVRNANLAEDFVFAWRRTGLLIGEETIPITPDVDLQEWQEAVEEYAFLKGRGFDPFYLFTYLDPHEYELYKRCVKLIENVIVIAFNSIRRKKRFPDLRQYFQHLVVCSALNSFRTVNEMYHHRYDDDCLAILRGIYEQYLRVKQLRLFPETVARFEAAVYAAAGVHSYKVRADGSLDFTRVIDPKTGRETRTSVSNFSIVNASDFGFDRVIYQELYNELSGHVHHDVATWALRGMVTQQLQLNRDQDSVRAIALVLFVGLLLLREMTKLEWILKRDKRDLRFGIKTLVRHLRLLLRCENVKLHSGLPPSILPAVEEIGAEV